MAMHPYLQFLARMPHCEAEHHAGVVVDIRNGTVFAEPKQGNEPKYQDLVRVRHAGVAPDVHFYVEGEKLVRLHAHIALSLGMLTKSDIKSYMDELRGRLAVL